MKKRTSVFRCSSCGHEEAKWLGRCPGCGEWNTIAEAAVKEPAARGGVREPPMSEPLLAVDPLEGKRTGSGIPELDLVLGGGIMKHSSILVGGEPGIGKSTLLLQIAASVKTKGRVLYVSGEESAGQIRMRADRLGVKSENIEILSSGRLEDIEAVLGAVKPVIVLIDSAQTLHSPDIGSIPGTINQMKLCTHELISWVKEHDAAIIFAAHVTKDGVIAGPKSLEHMVDTVLYFEDTAPGEGESRFLRAAKNRFGSVDEIGIFTMGEKGLTGVEDPSSLFLIHREGNLPPGVSTAAVLEGSRPLLMEIQALTVPAKGSMSRVFSDRVDPGRVSRVAATLEKHLGLRLSDHDLYVNVAGGIRISEVAVELALAAAVYSARTDIPLPSGTAIAGELSLAGEVRPVRRLPLRVKTAKNLGFEGFLGPAPDLKEGSGEPALTEEFKPAKTLKEAMAFLFSKNNTKK